ncbi:MAG: amino acid dehydrogenase [Saprospiraceae bacterium]|nr:amino acid dehydrogenase [Saprospiraceae bacterium]
MEAILNQFLEKRPEIVFEWKDALTDAEGWLVINSLNGGAAGGGTRMRLGLNKEEVLALAKVMEIKFKVSGPGIGGAKSGINFNPADPGKAGVLERWYKAIRPLLKTYYGTGGDLNVDESAEVLPILENLDVYHPQEGVLRGHFQLDTANTRKRLEQLSIGTKLPVVTKDYSPDGKGKYNVADMITGFGVSESIRHYYDIYHDSDLKNKRVVIQGWGNVGSAAAYYLSQCGAKIVCVQDREGGLIEEGGMTFDRVRELFLSKAGNKLNAPDLISPNEVQKRKFDLGAEVFVPAAASRLISSEEAQNWINQKLTVMSCGANVPFDENKYIYGPICKELDQKLSLIPDFVANCGMARVFANLMSTSLEVEETRIFKDVSVTIHEALRLSKVQSENLFGITKRLIQNYLNA